MDSDDSDFMLDDDFKYDVDAELLAARHGEASISNDDVSRDSSLTSASGASSSVKAETTATSSEEETEQVIPKTPKAKNRSRVIESDSEEESGPQPPKKKFARIRPIIDDTSESEDDNQPSTSKGPAKRNLFTIPKEEPSSDDGSDVEIIEDQQQASRLSRRLNPRPESPKRKGNITFEDGSEDDSGSDRSRDSEDPYEPAPERNQCYICEELDPNLRVSARRYADFSSWCECGCCADTSQMGDYDRICCQELKKVVEFRGSEVVLGRKCITQHPRFELDVLGFRALTRSNTRKSYRCTSNSKCFKAQWSFLRMIYDRIGFGGQAVVPACVSRAILDRFGNDGLYHIWYAKYHCNGGPHCHKMQLNNRSRERFRNNFRRRYSKGYRRSGRY